MRFPAGILFFAFSVSATFAQSDILTCKSSLKEGSTDADYLSCLDREVANIRQERDVLKEALMSVIAKQRAEMEDTLAAGDAEPDMVPLRPFVHATNGYWSGGVNVATHVCKGYSADIPNYKLLEVRSGQRVGGRGTCAPPPFCDSAGEFCEDVTVSGCYVKNGVYQSLVGRFGLDDAAILAICQ